MSETRDRTDDGADRATTDHGGRPCPRCGEAMIHRHCKYVCPVHGVVYDCSDTFY
ncbi:HVO_2523 family zinc finger protein [Halorubrum sp. 48-1-W]|uniref:HVO_2523 family zinc finger protein n=1 Tax=Halorubrum sp. 48-1-W TaxID=2249761 RepID=UPI0018E50826|nr:HVO_2523 family zinc finger protein [Halorubrum sp. 48-1-W]